VPLSDPSSLNLLVRSGGQMMAVTAAILLSLVVAVQVSAAPNDPSRIAAVFPPWWTAAQAVRAASASGRILGVGGAPFVVILQGDPRTLAAHARAVGALFILASNPAGFCAPRASEPKS